MNYAEGIYVGYRYYDKRKLPVRFPFGHGLTYTTFRYDNLRLSGDVFRGEPLKVEVDVTNTGRHGRQGDCTVLRPAGSSRQGPPGAGIEGL